MMLERVLRGIAGAFVLASLGMAVFHNRNWLYFTGLVGLMQFQSAFTDRCPMIWLLEQFGMKRCQA